VHLAPSPNGVGLVAGSLGLRHGRAVRQDLKLARAVPDHADDRGPGHQIADAGIAARCRFHGQRRAAVKSHCHRIGGVGGADIQDDELRAVRVADSRRGGGNDDICRARASVRGRDDLVAGEVFEDARPRAGAGRPDLEVDAIVRAVVVNHRSAVLVVGEVRVHRGLRRKELRVG